MTIIRYYSKNFLIRLTSRVEKEEVCKNIVKHREKIKNHLKHMESGSEH